MTYAELAEVLRDFEPDEGSLENPIVPATIESLQEQPEGDDGRPHLQPLDAATLTLEGEDPHVRVRFEFVKRSSLLHPANEDWVLTRAEMMSDATYDSLVEPTIDEIRLSASMFPEFVESIFSDAR